MCDDHTEIENQQHFRQVGVVSRRGFAALSATTLAACASAKPADAMEIVEQDVKITTPDGVADCHFAYPAKGKHAAVLVWPDIMGLRPAFRTMGKRLAESGYAVLTVNPFYRVQPAPILKEGESFQDPAVRGRLVPMMQALTPATQKTDATAFVAFLDAQKQVDTKRKIGTTGYCMGGPIVMRTAAYLPERIGAGASFHGGGLATKNPDSPHLLAPQMKADFLIAVAENDDQRDPEAKTLLRQAFDAAKIGAEIEVYPAMHGWCAIDSSVYNPEQAERAWARKLALFAKALA